MLLARQVFQAKYGRGDELVTLFQELNARMHDAGELTPQLPHPQRCHRSLLHRRHGDRGREPGCLGGEFRKSMERPWMGEWFSRMMPLVESGSRRVLQHRRMTALLTGS